MKIIRTRKHKNGRRTEKKIVFGASTSRGLHFAKLGQPPEAGEFTITNAEAPHESYSVQFTTRAEAEWIMAAARDFLERLPIGKETK